MAKKKKKEPDWEEIKKMYITTEMTYQQVADQFGLSRNTVKNRGVKEKWFIEKYQKQGKKIPENTKETKEINKYRLKYNMQGRKSKYIPEIHDPLVCELAKDNKTLREIAEKYLKIDAYTFTEWLKKHKSFNKSYYEGVNNKLDRIEQNLYTLADWNICKEKVVLRVTGKDGKEERVEEKETEKTVLPSLGAIKAILSTQRPDKWAEKKDRVEEDNREIRVIISEAKEPAKEDEVDGD